MVDLCLAHSRWGKCKGRAGFFSTLLGHASVAITLDLYSHLIEGMDADAAERMEEVFQQAI